MDGLYASLILILSGLALGYCLQLAQRAGYVRLPLEISSLRKLLQSIGLLVFMPVSFFGAVWVVSLSDIRVLLLPIIGFSVLMTGGGLGLLAARVLKKRRIQIGVMYCCGSFTNIGAIGGLVCYMFLGEAGFALVALYKMFEEMTYYTIGFPIARYYGDGQALQGKIVQRILRVFLDPFVATILCAFSAGLFLNLSGAERPPFFEKITALSVPAGTFTLIVSIGLGMRFSRLTNYLGACAAISIIKFLAMPLLGCSLAYLSGLHLVADGLPFKVIMILSSMPVAFNALVAASIFDLDLDLANSLWLFSTAMLVIVLPCLYLAVSAV